MADGVLKKGVDSGALTVEKTSSRAPGERKTRELLLSASNLGTRNGLAVYLGHVPAPKNAGTRGSVSDAG